MDTIVVVRLAGTNLINIVTPLEGTHGRQATSLTTAIIQLILDYMAGVSGISETPITIDNKGLLAYTAAVFPKLVDYCAQNCKNDLYLFDEVVDTTGEAHATPMVLQHRKPAHTELSIMTGFKQQQDADKALRASKVFTNPSKLIPVPRAAIQIRVKDTKLELNVFIVNMPLSTLTRFFKVAVIDIVNTHLDASNLNWMIVGLDFDGDDSLPDLIISRRDARAANNGYLVKPTPPPLPMIDVNLVDSAGKLQTLSLIITDRYAMGHKTDSIYDKFW